MAQPASAPVLKRAKLGLSINLMDCGWLALEPEAKSRGSALRGRGLSLSLRHVESKKGRATSKSSMVVLIRIVCLLVATKALIVDRIQESLE
jgi:hypothetical protein